MTHFLVLRNAFLKFSNVRNFKEKQKNVENFIEKLTLFAR